MGPSPREVVERRDSILTTTPASAEVIGPPWTAKQLGPPRMAWLGRNGCRPSPILYLPFTNHRTMPETDIAKHLPENSPVVEAIYAHYKRTGDAEPRRGYLGASEIGKPCERYLWYAFRGCVKRDFDGRMYRLFETGDHAEARFVADLRAIGCEVHDQDEDGRQFAVEALGGHFSGHLDGCVLGIPEALKTWHVLEFKTHNTKSFTRLKKGGVWDAKPEHYAQMQVYMHLTGMTRALYLAVNKDTDELYSERIHYDKEVAESLMERARRIVSAQSPPERTGSSADHWECRWCDARVICWAEDGSQPALPVPSLSCRQCCHATPLLDGVGGAWRCEKQARGLSADDQAKAAACEGFLVLPGLLAFAEAADFGVDESGREAIEFHNLEGGAEWKHGTGPGCYGSHELATLSRDLLVNQVVAATKALSGGVLAPGDTDILARYPESDCRILWRGPRDKLIEAWQELFSEDLRTLTPIAKSVTPFARAAEYEDGRVAVLFEPASGVTRHAEIREGVE